ncbi:hypothetical protein PLESTB_000113100 [Pleodorina starrii]|uniref:peptidyl-tRNA hydrolase n=1 Tax=Pleodorina starrii TaxID=330485 RepID=A0A9W6BB98_9CHLO|nr:hypothetical protein PLESTM_000108800 [Pleodorina starrii]GLC48578.1 hypothetical protein PLESTB_000113100 [Pleodorina starrii]GLC71899.1 hypothetical protein PLESTF_001178800 [Pleodorina starrii]
MSLLLSRKIVSGLCKGFKYRAPIGVAAPACWAMSKRPLADAELASALNPGNSCRTTSSRSANGSANTAASPSVASMPPPKRRRLQPVAAGPPAAQTAVAAPKAAAAAKPQAKPQPAAKAQEDGVWLIVGLGNPGSNYDDTRHNVGFMVVDELARQAGIDCRKLEKSAAVGKGELQGRQVLLVKPVTFMNNSGESVAALAKFYRVPPGRVLVVADDLDQPVAQVRLRQKGGHGGHNGLRSIIDRMGGSQDFPRIKIGIGRPSGPMPIASYVLQPFSKAERPDIDVAVQESVTIVKSVLALGLEKAASGQRI